MQFSTDQFQLNLISAYIPKCTHKPIIVYECTSVVIRAFLDFLHYNSTDERHVTLLTGIATKSPGQQRSLQKGCFEANNFLIKDDITLINPFKTNSQK